MREIKFNIYDKTTDTYYKNAEYDFNIDFGSKTIAITIREGYSEIVALDYEKEIECVLLQYTGLKDKNCNEIYEGDIVEIGDFTYSIKFEIGSFMLVRCSNETDMYAEFDNCWNDDVYPLCQLHWESNADEDILYNCEIIGNIYKNPELLDA